MAHKTITISEEAYKALSRIKADNESFTETILRITSGRGKASSLLKFIEATQDDYEELARNIEDSMKRTRKARIRSFSLPAKQVQAITRKSSRC